MENLNNDVFGFGVEINPDLEPTNNFDYDSISGLGESNYENEDLFNVEVENNDSLNDNYRIGSFDNLNNNINVNFENNIEQDFDIEEQENITNENDIYDFDNTYIADLEKDPNQYEEFANIDFTEFNVIPENKEEELIEVPNFEELSIGQIEENNNIEEQVEIPNMDFRKFSVIPENKEEELFIQPNLEESNTEQQEESPINFIENVNEEDISIEQNEDIDDEVTEITISDTPIEELNKLTHYEEDKIEKTDISALFDQVSINVKDASDIFRKNTDLKRKIDTRFEELKKLQSEIENSRKKQLDEINSYKEEVLTKLTEKKEEIEKRLNLLKESQSTLEKEKQEFEQYKKKEQQNIDRVQKEVQSAYDDRREELSHIEDILRKQKDALDEERSQLSLDRIEYESDKNELANNLLKFNELVNSFTNGIDDIKE